MRPLRLTKIEHGALRDLVAAQEPDKVWRSVLSKLDAAVESAPSVAAGPLETALMGSSRGKVVMLAGGPAYARASKMAAAVSATAEDMALVGAWLGRQAWLREPTTILGVLGKWGEWLPRARATVPPAALREGFTDGTQDTAGGPAGPGGGGGGRRPAPGFGGAGTDPRPDRAR